MEAHLFLLTMVPRVVSHVIVESRHERIMQKNTKGRRVIWTREKILSTIKARANSQGVVSAVPTLCTVSIRMFGSWRKACKEAGCIAFKDQPAIENCAIDGCLSKPRGKRSLYCDKHNARLRRNGHVELWQPPKLKDHSGGYKLLYAPTHPLSNGQPRVFEHRAVFYDAYGEGPFSCHWCNKEVSWSSLHIDHLNDKPDDNRVENLVGVLSFMQSAARSS